MTDVGIYIGLRKDFSFHTIILKKKIGRFTFFLSIGYAGGRVYDEFQINTFSLNKIPKTEMVLTLNNQNDSLFETFEIWCPLKN